MAKKLRRKVNHRNSLKKIDSANNVDSANLEKTFEGISVGEVVSVDDPQQMGRLRVFCPSLGDSFENDLVDIPWCQYGSPFGGFMGYGSRGSGDDETLGPVSYGMWAIPKIGASVLVACIDGNPLYRVWLGCLYGQFTTHTLPHGRYTFSGDGKPDGPLSTTEKPIQPLYKNVTEAFGDRNENFEYRTRAADHQVANVDSIRTSGKDEDGHDLSNNVISDDEDLSSGTPYGNGKEYISNQGYEPTRQHPEIEGEARPKSLDSQVYSWTTPGFHSISMDDKRENCRMRFRSTGGHQIILDDTNERIYISTAKGKNWIEMDEVGNIDVFTEGNYNVHARENINFTAGKTIRMYAGEGIHLKSEDEYRLHANKDIHIHTDMFYRQKSVMETRIDADMDIHVKSMMNIKTYSLLETHILATTDMFVESLTGTMMIRSKEKMGIESVNANMDIRSLEELKLESVSKDFHALAKENFFITAIASGNILVTGGNLTETATNIFMNPSIPAFPATPTIPTDPAEHAEIAEEFWAWAVSRVPQKDDGWGRVALKPGAGSPLFVENNDPLSEPENKLLGWSESGKVGEDMWEYPYDSPSVGLMERERIFVRGEFWRR
jgi:hypothetical protein